MADAADARDQFSGFLQSAVEVYLTPFGVTVGGSRLRAAGDLTARLLREFGGIGQAAAIEIMSGSDGGVAARAVRPPTPPQFQRGRLRWGGRRPVSRPERWGVRLGDASAGQLWRSR